MPDAFIASTPASRSRACLAGGGGLASPGRYEKMTIETHYNYLRLQSEFLNKIADLEFPRDESPLAKQIIRAAVRRIMEKATGIAAADWPRQRAQIAARGDAMPDGPVEFASSGYCPRRFGDFAICKSRMGGHDPNYIDQAIEILRPEFEHDAARASEEWETYRRAVEQGVALPPEKSK